MAVYVAYSTPRQACVALEQVCTDKIGKLAPRPWNLYQPDTTDWWLVRSSEWPAYKHGKLHFEWSSPQREALDIALHIEKGLDASVSSAYSCPKAQRYIMDRSWTWYRLIRDLENGQLGQRLLDLAGSLPLPLVILINGQYVTDPCEYEPSDPGFPWDYYRFELGAPTGRLTLVSSHSDADVLAPMATLETLGDLPAALREVTSNKWAWMNLYVGARFPIGHKHELTEEATVWGASELWENLIVHLAGWLI